MFVWHVVSPVATVTMQCRRNRQMYEDRLINSKTRRDRQTDRLTNSNYRVADRLTADNWLSARRAKTDRKRKNGTALRWNTEDGTPEKNCVVTGNRTLAFQHCKLAMLQLHHQDTLFMDGSINGGRQTDRQTAVTDKQAYKRINKHADWQTDREQDRLKARQTESKTDR